MTLVASVRALVAMLLLAPPVAPSTTWTFTALYDFFPSGQPSYYGDLVLDKNGVIYGTSWSGGAAGWAMPTSSRLRTAARLRPAVGSVAASGSS